MRHNKKINHLGRTSSHRQAMLSNMASSLIKHKRIYTTTAKAKALRKYVEPLLTKSKDDTTHSRRVVFASLQDKNAVTELFTHISEKVENRPGGYTRIIKTGNRLGDNAAMCFIELVDFNENMLKDKKKTTGKTRRSRKKSSLETVASRADAMPKSAEKTSKAVEVEAATEVAEVATEVVEVATEVAEAATEVAEVATEVAEAATEVVEAAPEVADAAPETEVKGTGDENSDKEAASSE